MWYCQGILKKFERRNTAMRRRTTANICELKKYIYFLSSHIFAVVLRRIAVFLLSNLFTFYHCKHPRIRRATLVSCPFLLRFILILKKLCLVHTRSFRSLRSCRKTQTTKKPSLSPLHNKQRTDYSYMMF